MKEGMLIDFEENERLRKEYEDSVDSRKDLEEDVRKYPLTFDECYEISNDKTDDDKKEK